MKKHSPNSTSAHSAGSALRALAAASLCAAAALCGPAFSATVVYNYTGVVDYDEADRGWAAFAGQFTFEDTAIDQIADPSTAAYKMSGSPYGMNVVFDGSSAFSFNNFFDILVSNNLGGADQFGALAQNTGSPDSLGLTLYDYTQAVFASDALPLPSGGLTLAMFGWSEFKYESSGSMLNGRLTGLSCVAGCDATSVPPAVVPVPATNALVLAGLGLLGCMQLRKRAF